MTILCKFLLIPILCSILFVHCEAEYNPYVSDDNSLSGKELVTLMSITYYFMLKGQITRVATDNMDGTVTISDVDFDGNSTTVGYIKKCLQGQVYREGENDCQGAGSASDVYGAEKLQYCDTEDNSCNGGVDDGVLDGGGNSEVFDSCDSETLLDKKWYAGIKGLSSVISSYPYQDTIFSHIYDLYDVDGNIWNNSSKSSIQAYLYIVVDNDLDKTLSRSSLSKIEKNYLLCITNN